MRNFFRRFAPSLLLLVACAHAGPGPTQPPRAFQLLGASGGAEATEGHPRDELRLEGSRGEPTTVIASGQTPLIQRQKARGKLYGDAGASRGFWVEDFVMLEVLGAEGQLLSRAVVGGSAPLRLEQQRLQQLGPSSQRFEPGEIDLTALLPEQESFRIRATALKAGAAGKVSDLFLVLSEP